MKKTPAKKRNPQDTTLRNAHAANRKIAKLREEMDWLTGRVELLRRDLLNHINLSSPGL